MSKSYAMDPSALQNTRNRSESIGSNEISAQFIGVLHQGANLSRASSAKLYARQEEAWKSKWPATQSLLVLPPVVYFISTRYCRLITWKTQMRLSSKMFLTFSHPLGSSFFFFFDQSPLGSLTSQSRYSILLGSLADVLS